MSQFSDMFGYEPTSFKRKEVHTELVKTVSEHIAQYGDGAAAVLTMKFANAPSFVLGAVLADMLVIEAKKTTPQPRASE